MKKLNHQRAIDFIRAHGEDEIDAEVRLDYMLEGIRLNPSLYSLFFHGQQPDGGFLDFNDKTYTSIDVTVYYMSNAEKFGLTEEDEPVKNMIRFLLSRQREDGRICEEDSFAEKAPPWAKPGNLSAELYHTASAGYWLALFGQREAAIRAANYLASHLDILACRLPTSETGRWMAAGLWWQLGMTGSAECVFKQIQFDIPDMIVAHCGILLTNLLLGGLPRDHWLVEIAVQHLEDGQEADGSYSGYDNDEVLNTLDVLRALILVYGNPEKE